VAREEGRIGNCSIVAQSLGSAASNALSLASGS